MEISMNRNAMALQKQAISCKHSTAVSGNDINYFVSVMKDMLGELTQPIEKEYMDASDVCHYLGISKSHLYKLSHKKVFPKHKLGKKIYFKKEDINNALESNRLMSKAEIEIAANRHYK